MNPHQPTTTQISLKDLSSIKIGGTAKFYAEVSEIKDLLEVIKWTKAKKMKIYPLGGGNNTIFKDENYNCLFIKFKNDEILKTYENDDFVNITVGAGVDWDDFVQLTIENGLVGLECLSGIPGTVGASPIQNIGAYGCEVAGVISSVNIIDLNTTKEYCVASRDCDFKYRDSVFKQNVGSFIITSVSFSLKKVSPEKASGDLVIPQYKDLQLYFLGKQKRTAPALEIREAVLEIRSKKIPWPKDIPNSGSFFKNPIVAREKLDSLKEKYPDIPHFKLKDGVLKDGISKDGIKIYSGWLIEKAGLKGYDFGKIKIHDKNALILINPEGLGNYQDLENAVTLIKEKIQEKFQIRLEIEPNIVVNF